MTNGKCPTWLVVKWLEKHPTHTAKSPRTPLGLAAMRAKNCSDVLSFEYEFLGIWRESLMQHRSDWTIYNERGKRVRFKRKPNWRKLLRAVVNSYDAVCSSCIDNDATHTATCVETQDEALMHAREALERSR